MNGSSAQDRLNLFQIELAFGSENATKTDLLFVIVFYGILCFSLVGLAHLIAALANAIYIKALSSRSKFFGHGNFCYYLLHSGVR